jgi:hypothetical protein
MGNGKKHNKKTGGQCPRCTEFTKKTKEMGDEIQRFKDKEKRLTAELEAQRKYSLELEQSSAGKPTVIVDDTSESFTSFMDGLINLQNNATLNKMDEGQHQVKLRQMALDQQLNFLERQQQIYGKHPDVIEAKKESLHKRRVSMTMSCAGIFSIFTGIYMAVAGTSIVFYLGFFTFGALMLLAGFVPFIDATDADKFKKMAEAFHINLDKIGLLSSKKADDTVNSGKERG